MPPLSRLDRSEIRNRILGCLIGSAVGDAYGLATEFMTKAMAKRLYGNGPIAFGNDPGYPVWEDHHRLMGDRNDFTDDTDQLLVILQSLEQTRNGILDPINVANRLLEWRDYGIPELGTEPGRGLGYTVGRVMSHPDFSVNPHRAAFEVWDASGRELAPNGAVMRTAVTGIESFWDEPRVVENTIAAAKITHADPRSVLSALISSVLISRFLRGGGTDAAADEAQAWNPSLSNPAYRRELLAYLQRGSTLQGEHSLNPTYDRATSQFQPKDYELLELKRLGEQRVGEFANDQFQDKDASLWNANRVPVTLRPSIGWAGIDQVGEDEAVSALARSVVADYKFLLLDTDVAPPSSPQHGSRVQDVWAKELDDHCFPQTLDQLALDDTYAIGYTLKCVGVSYYGVTRREDSSPTLPEYQGPSGLFRGLMEQVTLEGGDADTNDAVMGSLLGARFGLDKGIPNAWWTGLKHRAWLENTIGTFADRVLSSYDTECNSN
ncbi:hypothetical protein BGX34_000524 [Mortierella sp. NVP85]|nr:hypothetical protein BGX34_000524 [Mortierella sp. NVP85]